MLSDEINERKTKRLFQVGMALLTSGEKVEVRQLGLFRQALEARELDAPCVVREDGSKTSSPTPEIRAALQEVTVLNLFK